MYRTAEIFGLTCIQLAGQNFEESDIKECPTRQALQYTYHYRRVEVLSFESYTEAYSRRRSNAEDCDELDDARYGKLTLNQVQAKAKGDHRFVQRNSEKYLHMTKPKTKWKSYLSLGQGLIEPQTLLGEGSAFGSTRRLCYRSDCYECKRNMRHNFQSSKSQVNLLEKF